MTQAQHLAATIKPGRPLSSGVIAGMEEAGRIASFLVGTSWHHVFRDYSVLIDAGETWRVGQIKWTKQETT